jgi:exodeoxyribonuclease V gamma subunit
LLFVERSNRTERLLEGLARRLMLPGRDPLAPDVVVVQGPGMERWIAQSIARDFGVFANAAFPFPRDFLERVFRAIPDDTATQPDSKWSPQHLTWRIARRLVEGRDDPDFAPLSRHLHAVDGDWRLVQLSHRIASLLDQYITFRPDWVSKWLTSAVLPVGRDERWQARLFREIHAEIGPGHVADRALEFHNCVETGDRAALADRLQSEFPSVIEIFAITTLPPLYLSVIADLAKVRDLRLSVLSPSRHYWADLWRELKDEQAGEIGASRLPDSVFDTAGTSPSTGLLVELGRLGSDFQRNLEECGELQDADEDLFESPSAKRESPSLLERFQRRLLDLDDADASLGASDRIVRREDDSIRFHVCHGPRRELEVVQAALRAAFERDETLTPEDVIVMAPQIDEIAPDIEAVFGSSIEDAGEIPYRIADRGVFRRSPVAQAFQNLLVLLTGRATRSELLEWLAREPVRERFGLDERGVEILADWSESAGVRFGLDEHHRERLGLSRERAHTWSGGLDRLALAHATGASGDVFEGLSPVALDAMGDAQLLGAMGDVESVLSEAIGNIRKPRNVAAWCSWLRVLFDRTHHETDSNAHEHGSIRSVLTELARSSTECQFDHPIPFEAIRERVCHAIESMPSVQPFLSGGVTFCELVPLRAIPFRVIVLVGMADDTFPRGGRPPGFDLMGQSPRPGDRTIRNDDRYLFLEALLSARDQLILTAPGRDMRDGGDRPPSVVVSDLLETLNSLFELEPEGGDEKSLREWLVVAHPLQATSPRYFESPGDPRLQGRDSEAFAGANVRLAAMRSNGGTQRRFLFQPLDIDGDDPVVAHQTVLDLDTMIERFLRSSRWFTRDRLQMRLPRPETAVQDLDPIDFDPLLQYGLGSGLLDGLWSGETNAEALNRLMANASVPSGVHGRLATRSLANEIEEVARIGLARRSGTRLSDLDFELDLGTIAPYEDCRLVGRLDQLWPEGRIEVGFSRIGRRGELDAWIRHLVLCALVEDGATLFPTSIFVGRTESKKSTDRVVVFKPVDDPRSHLAGLVEWTLASADTPLPFFPKTSRAFATKSIAGKTEQAWREAHQSFDGGEGGNFSFPESEEELEFARLWEGWSPLDSTGALPTRYRFDELAEAFFEPLLAAREVDRE